MIAIRVVTVVLAAGAALLAVDRPPGKTATPSGQNSWWQTPAASPARRADARKNAAAAKRSQPAEPSRLAIEPLRWPARDAAPDHSRWVITLPSEK